MDTLPVEQDLVAAPEAKRDEPSRKGGGGWRILGWGKGKEDSQTASPPTEAESSPPPSHGDLLETATSGSGTFESDLTTINRLLDVSQGKNRKTDTENEAITPTRSAESNETGETVQTKEDSLESSSAVAEQYVQQPSSTENVTADVATNTTTTTSTTNNKGGGGGGGGLGWFGGRRGAKKEATLEVLPAEMPRELPVETEVVATKSSHATNKRSGGWFARAATTTTTTEPTGEDAAVTTKTEEPPSGEPTTTLDDYQDVLVPNESFLSSKSYESVLEHSTADSTKETPLDLLNQSVDGSYVAVTQESAMDVALPHDGTAVDSEVDSTDNGAHGWRVELDPSVDEEEEEAASNWTSDDDAFQVELDECSTHDNENDLASDEHDLVHLEVPVTLPDTCDRGTLVTTEVSLAADEVYTETAPYVKIDPMMSGTMPDIAVDDDAVLARDADLDFVETAEFAMPDKNTANDDTDAETNKQPLRTRRGVQRQSTGDSATFESLLAGSSGNQHLKPAPRRARRKANTDSAETSAAAVADDKEKQPLRTRRGVQRQSTGDTDTFEALLAGGRAAAAPTAAAAAAADELPTKRRGRRKATADDITDTTVEKEHESARMIVDNASTIVPCPTDETESNLHAAASSLSDVGGFSSVTERGPHLAMDELLSDPVQLEHLEMPMEETISEPTLTSGVDEMEADAADCEVEAEVLNEPTPNATFDEPQVSPENVARDLLNETSISAGDVIDSRFSVEPPVQVTELGETCIEIVDEPEPQSAGLASELPQETERLIAVTMDQPVAAAVAAAAVGLPNKAMANIPRDMVDEMNAESENVATTLQSDTLTVAADFIVEELTVASIDTEPIQDRVPELPDSSIGPGDEGAPEHVEEPSELIEHTDVASEVTSETVALDLEGTVEKSSIDCEHIESVEILEEPRQLASATTETLEEPVIESADHSIELPDDKVYTDDPEDDAAQKELQGGPAVERADFAPDVTRDNVVLEAEGANEASKIDDQHVVGDEILAEPMQLANETAEACKELAIESADHAFETPGDSIGAADEEDPEEYAAPAELPCESVVERADVSSDVTSDNLALEEEDFAADESNIDCEHIATNEILDAPTQLASETVEDIKELAIESANHSLEIPGDSKDGVDEEDPEDAAASTELPCEPVIERADHASVVTSDNLDLEVEGVVEKSDMDRDPVVTVDILEAPRQLASATAETLQETVIESADRTLEIPGDSNDAVDEEDPDDAAPTELPGEPVIERADHASSDNAVLDVEDFVEESNFDHEVASDDILEEEPMHISSETVDAIKELAIESADRAFEIPGYSNDAVDEEDPEDDAAPTELPGEPAIECSDVAPDGTHDNVALETEDAVGESKIECEGDEIPEEPMQLTSETGEAIKELAIESADRSFEIPGDSIDAVDEENVDGAAVPAELVVESADVKSADTVFEIPCDVDEEDPEDDAAPTDLRCEPIIECADVAPDVTHDNVALETEDAVGESKIECEGDEIPEEPMQLTSETGEAIKELAIESADRYFEIPCDSIDAVDEENFDGAAVPAELVVESADVKSADTAFEIPCDNVDVVDEEDTEDDAASTKLRGGPVIERADHAPDVPSDNAALEAEKDVKESNIHCAHVASDEIVEQPMQLASDTTEATKELSMEPADCAFEIPGHSIDAVDEEDPEDDAAPAELPGGPVNECACVAPGVTRDNVALEEENAFEESIIDCDQITTDESLEAPAQLASETSEATKENFDGAAVPGELIVESADVAPEVSSDTCAVGMEDSVEKSSIDCKHVEEDKILEESVQLASETAETIEMLPEESSDVATKLPGGIIGAVYELPRETAMASADAVPDVAIGSVALEAQDAAIVSNGDCEHIASDEAISDATQSASEKIETIGDLAVESFKTIEGLDTQAGYHASDIKSADGAVVVELKTETSEARDLTVDAKARSETACVFEDGAAEHVAPAESHAESSTATPEPEQDNVDAPIIARSKVVEVAEEESVSVEAPSAESFDVAAVLTRGAVDALNVEESDGEPSDCVTDLPCETDVPKIDATALSKSLEVVAGKVTVELSAPPELEQPNAQCPIASTSETRTLSDEGVVGRDAEPLDLSADSAGLPVDFEQISEESNLETANVAPESLNESDGPTSEEVLEQAMVPAPTAEYAEVATEAEEPYVDAAIDMVVDESVEHAPAVVATAPTDITEKEREEPHADAAIDSEIVDVEVDESVEDAPAVATSTLNDINEKASEEPHADAAIESEISEESNLETANVPESLKESDDPTSEEVLEQAMVPSPTVEFAEAEELHADAAIESEIVDMLFDESVEDTPAVATTVPSDIAERESEESHADVDVEVDESVEDAPAVATSARNGITENESEESHADAAIESEISEESYLKTANVAPESLNESDDPKSEDVLEQAMVPSLTAEAATEAEELHADAAIESEIVDMLFEESVEHAPAVATTAPSDITERESEEPHADAAIESEIVDFEVDEDAPAVATSARNGITENESEESSPQNIKECEPEAVDYSTSLPNKNVEPTGPHGESVDVALEFMSAGASTGDAREDLEEEQPYAESTYVAAEQEKPNEDAPAVATDVVVEKEREQSSAQHVDEPKAGAVDRSTDLPIRGFEGTDIAFTDKSDGDATNTTTELFSNTITNSEVDFANESFIEESIDVVGAAKEAFEEAELFKRAPEASTRAVLNDKVGEPEIQSEDCPIDIPWGDLEANEYATATEFTAESEIVELVDVASAMVPSADFVMTQAINVTQEEILAKASEGIFDLMPPPTSETVVNDSVPECPFKVAEQAEHTRKSVVVLISGQSFKREVAVQQDKLLTALNAQAVEHMTVDGADPACKDQRNDLFALSGLRGKYPQIFVTDGTVVRYWGDYDRFEHANDDGTLASELGIQTVEADSVKHIQEVVEESNAPVSLDVTEEAIIKKPNVESYNDWEEPTQSHDVERSEDGEARAAIANPNAEFASPESKTESVSLATDLHGVPTEELVARLDDVVPEALSNNDLLRGVKGVADEVIVKDPSVQPSKDASELEEPSVDSRVASMTGDLAENIDKSSAEHPILNEGVAEPTFHPSSEDVERCERAYGEAPNSGIGKVHETAGVIGESGAALSEVTERPVDADPVNVVSMEAQDLAKEDYIEEADVEVADLAPELTSELSSDIYDLDVVKHETEAMHRIIDSDNEHGIYVDSNSESADAAPAPLADLDASRIDEVNEVATAEEAVLEATIVGEFEQSSAATGDAPLDGTSDEFMDLPQNVARASIAVSDDEDIEQREAEATDSATIELAMRSIGFEPAAEFAGVAHIPPSDRVKSVFTEVPDGACAEVENHGTESMDHAVDSSSIKLAELVIGAEPRAESVDDVPESPTQLGASAIEDIAEGTFDAGELEQSNADSVYSDVAAALTRDSIACCDYEDVEHPGTERLDLAVDSKNHDFAVYPIESEPIDEPSNVQELNVESIDVAIQEPKSPNADSAAVANSEKVSEEQLIADSDSAHADLAPVHASETIADISDVGIKDRNLELAPCAADLDAENAEFPGRPRESVDRTVEALAKEAILEMELEEPNTDPTNVAASELLDVTDSPVVMPSSSGDFAKESIVAVPYEEVNNIEECDAEELDDANKLNEVPHGTGMVSECIDELNAADLSPRMLSERVEDVVNEAVEGVEVEMPGCAGALTREDVESATVDSIPGTSGYANIDAIAVHNKATSGDTASLPNETATSETVEGLDAEPVNYAGAKLREHVESAAEEIIPDVTRGSAYIDAFDEHGKAAADDTSGTETAAEEIALEVNAESSCPAPDEEVSVVDGIIKEFDQVVSGQGAIDQPQEIIESAVKEIVEGFAAVAPVQKVPVVSSRAMHNLLAPKKLSIPSVFARDSGSSTDKGVDGVVESGACEKRSTEQVVSKEISSSVTADLKVPSRRKASKLSIPSIFNKSSADELQGNSNMDGLRPNLAEAVVTPASPVEKAQTRNADPTAPTAGSSIRVVPGATKSKLAIPSVFAKAGLIKDGASDPVHGGKTATANIPAKSSSPQPSSRPKLRKLSIPAAFGGDDVKPIRDKAHVVTDDRPGTVQTVGVLKVGRELDVVEPVVRADSDSIIALQQPFPPKAKALSNVLIAAKDNEPTAPSVSAQVFPKKKLSIPSAFGGAGAVVKPMSHDTESPTVADVKATATSPLKPETIPGWPVVGKKQRLSIPSAFSKAPVSDSTDLTPDVKLKVVSTQPDETANPNMVGRTRELSPLEDATLPSPRTSEAKPAKLNRPTKKKLAIPAIFAKAIAKTETVEEVKPPPSNAFRKKKLVIPSAFGGGK
jgi:hypothetical protein